MIHASVSITLLLILAAGLLSRWCATARTVSASIRFLDSRWAPAVVWLITCVVALWVWGGTFHPVATVHDEASYLLQARIFATFHWTAPGRPLPQFFEQYHVFVTPHLMSKYPPGHALLMVPGIWIGLPALVPLLFIGLTGLLVYALARRVANPAVALVTWIIWLTSPAVLQRLPSYLSESTSGMLWLAGWWAILRWRDDGRTRWLLLLAACIGWGALTRPYTWVLYAIPVAMLVGWALISRHAWREIGFVVVIGGCSLALLLLWSARSTGNPFQTPYSMYAQEYFPEDVLGFGANLRQPSRVLPDDMQKFSAWTHDLHVDHTVRALPRILASRSRMIRREMWGGWRMPLLFFAVLGLMTMSGAVAFSVASSAILVLGYLAYAHASTWTVYYLEIQPVLAFLSAFGLWRFLTLFDGRSLALWLSRSTGVLARDGAAMMLVVILLAPKLVLSVIGLHSARRVSSAYHRGFRDAVMMLPGERLIVFIRYAPDHSPHQSLITNEPDLALARAWTVYDRGPEDSRLMRLAPERIPYLYDEQKGEFSLLDTAKLAAAADGDRAGSARPPAHLTPRSERAARSFSLRSLYSRAAPAR